MYHGIHLSIGWWAVPEMPLYGVSGIALSEENNPYIKQLLEKELQAGASYE